MAIRPCQRGLPTANSLQAKRTGEFAGTSSIAQRCVTEKNNYLNNSVYLAIFLLVTSCAQSSINTNQLNSALDNIGCYKELFDEIITNENLWKELLEIRNDKLRGSGDPVTIEQGYRLIELNEFSANLNIVWIQKCETKLVQRNDLRGIRIPNKEVIVIEIDKFERGGIEREFSRGR